MLAHAGGMCHILRMTRRAFVSVSSVSPLVTSSVVKQLFRVYTFALLAKVDIVSCRFCRSSHRFQRGLKRKPMALIKKLRKAVSVPIPPPPHVGSVFSRAFSVKIVSKIVLLSLFRPRRNARHLKVKSPSLSERT